MYEFSSFVDVEGVKRNFQIMEPMSDYGKKYVTKSSQVCGVLRETCDQN